MVALDALPVLRELTGSGRGAGQDLGEAALVLRREVLHEDVGEAAVGRDPLEEALECLEAAGRGADADDEETLALLGAPIGFLRVYFGSRGGQHGRRPLSGMCVTGTEDG